MLIAGPCSLESYEKALDDALCCKNYGIEYFRAGAFKPRTSPKSFQGLREEGLKILSQIKQETGLKIVTELVDSDYLPLYSDVDIIQIGSRNCQNFELLKKVAMNTNKPILLKRGFGMTIQEFINAADYLKEYGAKEIILCERGIKTFENSTRNTLDLAAVPIIQNTTDYKIIVDPSHGTGKRELVIPMSKAALAIGADGLIVESTKNPEDALTDGFQTINHDQLLELKKQFDIFKKI
jgi:3-deoxy-7-phosphoheptulonate synthase